jgi:hypothetical protein
LWNRKFKGSGSGCGANSGVKEAGVWSMVERMVARIHG